LTDQAFPEGAIFTRARDKLIGDAQEEALRNTLDEIEAEKDQEYIRQLTKSYLSAQQAGVVDQLSATVSSVAETAAAPITKSLEVLENIENIGLALQPTQGQATGDLSSMAVPPQFPLTLPIGAVAQLAGQSTGEATQREAGAVSPQPQVIPTSAGIAINLVTPARKIEKLIPTQRIFINLPAVIEHSGGDADLLLEEGDEIVIPRIRQTVLVTGAVIHAGSFPYQKGKNLQDYLELAGGYARDADKEAVYVLKANGFTFNIKKVKRIDRGDVIVVPTRVMVETVSNRWGQVLGIIRLAVVAGTTAFLISRLR
jgi:hypothetical protein